MIDHYLRTTKERLLGRLVVGPLRQVHPTAVTLLAAAVGLATAVAAWQALTLLALGLWLVNRVLDGLDGTIARRTGRQSDLGGYLDIVLDHVVYAAIPIGLMVADGSQAAYLVLALLLASFYINNAAWLYLAALLEKRGGGTSTRGELTAVTMPSGLIEGFETVLFYSLALLLPSAMISLFGLMAILTLLTAAQRAVWAIGHLQPTRLATQGATVTGLTEAHHLIDKAPSTRRP